MPWSAASSAVALRRPDPPRDVSIEESESGIRIAWRPPAQDAEGVEFRVVHILNRERDVFVG